MRKQLKTKVGVRKIFTGTFEKYGFAMEKDGTPKSTALLLNIKAKGVVVADHAWLKVTNEFREAGSLSKGDKIMFSARIVPYKKQIGNMTDFGFETPTKVKRCISND
jgi:hypothetical protein